ncbi:MFS general substrate transporter [Mycena floridula]|nr:MFS general substrate transporter [Mycena floridula]
MQVARVCLHIKSTIILDLCLISLSDGPPTAKSHILPSSRRTSRSSIQFQSSSSQKYNSQFVSSQEDSALADDVEEPSIPISPLSVAHTSARDATFSLPRYHDAVLPTLQLDPAKLPSSSTTSTAYNSRQASVIEIGLDVPPRRQQVKLRLASCFFLYFLFGYGDGVTGTVLPYFQSEFRLSYMVSSLLFAGSTSGFFTATMLVERILGCLGIFSLHRTRRTFVPSFLFFSFNASSPEKHGFSASQARYVSLLVFCAVHTTFFLIMGLAKGFPELFLAYVVSSFARGITTASVNAFLVKTTQGGLGYAYAAWSFGGAISPIVCQALVASGVPWQHFYLGSIVISALNITFLALTFRPSSEELAQEINAFPIQSEPTSSDKTSKDVELVDKLPSQSSSTTRVTSSPHCQDKTLQTALSLPYQWAFSFFLFLYCGSETTTQGLMVTYLIATRHANRNTVGYVTSGFWFGITAGRMFWGYFSARQCFVDLVSSSASIWSTDPLVAVALLMHILIFLVDSNIENSFSTAVIGAVYGPVYPATLAMTNDLLPSKVHLVSMGILSAFGSLGGSIFPFIGGTIASIKGAKTLPYLTVAQSAVLLAIWTLFPNQRRH